MEQALEHGMAVRRHGAGPAIVYLHGLGEAGACFDPVVHDPALAGFTHVVPDLPGYGRSAWPAQPATLDALADHLVAWLRAHVGAPAVVAGHSMGGVLGVLIAERAPAAVRALVNLDGNLSSGDCVFSSKAAAMSAAEITTGGLDRLREALYPQGVTSAAIRGYTAAMRFADPASYHRHSCDLVALSATEAMADRFAALAMPTVFVAGVPDGVCERSRALLAAAGARWIAVEPAGHWVFVDQPARCAAIIADLASQAR